MSTAAGDLRELHHLHVRLQQVQQDLERGPKQIKAREQYSEKKRSALEAQREEMLKYKKVSDQKSLELRMNESKISELTLKLNAASSNREFDILKGQIDADSMANSVLEDEILECLEKVDQAELAIQQLGQEHSVAQEAERRVAEEVSVAEPALRQEIEILEASISEGERTLPGEVAEVYRRLVKSHGAAALAPVENDACSACYVGLSHQSRVELNSGKILFCKNCDRLLYLPGP